MVTMLYYMVPANVEKLVNNFRTVTAVNAVSSRKENIVCSLHLCFEWNIFPVIYHSLSEAVAGYVRT